MKRFLLYLAIFSTVFASHAKTPKIVRGDIVNETGPVAITVHYEDPVFPGGEKAMYKFLEENINYPEEAEKDNAYGKVVVEFQVLTDGSITNIQLNRKVHPALDQEALRVVSLLPKFKACIYPDYKPVTYYLPIHFEPLSPIEEADSTNTTKALNR